MAYYVHVHQFTRDDQSRFKQAAAARGVTMGLLLGALIRLALKEKVQTINAWPTCEPTPRARTKREQELIDERARIEAELFGAKRRGRPPKGKARSQSETTAQWVIAVSDDTEELLTRLAVRVRLPRSIVVSKLIRAYFDFRLRFTHER